MLVSNCCYAPETQYYFAEHQVCPKCKEHCVFVLEETAERPDLGGREFSPAQLEQIDALQKAWDEQAAQEAADDAEWYRQQQEQENHPPYKHCARCDAPSYDLSASACWNCSTEFVAA